MTGPVKLLVDGITCRFGDTTALSEVSLQVAPREFLSIVGPSGCGKSTLFNVISGLIRPSEGRVVLDDTDITGQTGHVGYMLQKDLLLPWRTVVGNIVLGLALTRRLTAADRVKAAHLATRYGLGNFLDYYPHALSGGMRQRAALMRTLILDVDTMLLDEPFGALDYQTRLAMQAWLLRVWTDDRRTVLFVTHDVDEAIFLSDRVLVMTGRPGHFAAELEVGLPRPRDVSMLTGPRFMEVKRAILDLLHVTADASAPGRVA